MGIIEQLIDLRKQATTERSHYYVDGVCSLAISEIRLLMTVNATLLEACEEANRILDNGIDTKAKRMCKEAIRLAKSAPYNK